jgi:hypothetical protein
MYTPIPLWTASDDLQLKALIDAGVQSPVPGGCGRLPDLTRAPAQPYAAFPPGEAAP